MLGDTSSPDFLNAIKNIKLGTVQISELLLLEDLYYILIYLELQLTEPNILVEEVKYLMVFLLDIQMHKL